jgi:hypothetical protein
VGNDKFARGTVLLSLAAGGCTGKQRDFVSLTETPSLLPNEPDASAAATIPGSSLGKGQPSESLDASVEASGGSGLCDEDGNCRCNTDTEVCAPLPLCADAGATCETTCPGCFIDGECTVATAVNPNNPCQICDPAREEPA